MKIREIILDFTSLLDVIMIILFFFILFSTLDIENVTKSAEEAQASYESLKAETEKEHEEWQQKADEEWDRILSIDKNAAKNQQALLAYNEGAIIAFNLQNVEKSDVWTLTVLSGNVKLSEIDAIDSDTLTNIIIGLFSDNGLKSDDVIISTLTYDGNSLGTEGAVPVVEKAIKNIQSDYENLYFTTINVSK